MAWRYIIVASPVSPHARLRGARFAARVRIGGRRVSPLASRRRAGGANPGDRTARHRAQARCAGHAKKAVRTLSMQAASFRFDVTRNPWHLYLSEPEYGSLGYSGSHDWHILQGRYLLCLLFEYAATLGLIDVAYTDPDNARPDFTHMWGADYLAYLSRYDGLHYFRLNPLGAYCLGLAEIYEPSVPPARGATPTRSSACTSPAGTGTRRAARARRGRGICSRGPSARSGCRPCPSQRRTSGRAASARGG